MYSESEIVVRYAETDRMGITHHANYAVWFEVGRTDLSKALGFPYLEMERMGIALPLLELHCQFRQASTYADVLTVRTWVSSLSAAKIRFSYEVYKAGTEKPICTGYTLHGIVSTQSLRPLNFKKKFPECYEIFAQAVEE